MFKRTISLFTYTAMLVIFVAMAGVQDAAADEKSGKALVGSWMVSVASPFGVVTDVTTINKDGTMSNSDAMFGTGHGVWKYLGDSQYAFKFVTPTLLLSASFAPGSIVTVTGTLTVEDDAATATGPYLLAVEPPGGGGGYSFPGSLIFTRISIDDQHYDDD